MIKRPHPGQVVGLHFRDQIAAHHALEGRLAIVDLIQPDGKPPICVLPVAGGARTWVYRSNLVRVPVRRHRKTKASAGGRPAGPTRSGPVRSGGLVPPGDKAPGRTARRTVR